MRRLLLLLVAPLLLTAGPAWADDDVASLPDGLYSYQGTITDEPNGPGGGGFTDAQVSFIECSNGACTVDAVGVTAPIAPGGQFYC